VDEVHVWRVPLGAFATNDDSRLNELSEAEYLRGRRFRFEADRRRFLGSHVALREILASYLSVSPRDLVFGEGAHGKPFLQAPTHAPTLCFSVSHSEDMALIAASRGREVGVDLERLRLIDGAGIAAQFFSPAEREALSRVAPDHQLRAFLATWVLKEAYLKACGDGLMRKLEDFDVTVGDQEAPRLLAVRDRAGDEARWTLRRLDPGEGFVAALAVQGSGGGCVKGTGAGSS